MMSREFQLSEMKRHQRSAAQHCTNNHWCSTVHFNISYEGRSYVRCSYHKIKIVKTHNYYQFSEYFILFQCLCTQPLHAKTSHLHIYPSWQTWPNFKTQLECFFLCPDFQRPSQVLLPGDHSSTCFYQSNYPTEFQLSYFHGILLLDSPI